MKIIILKMQYENSKNVLETINILAKIKNVKITIMSYDTYLHIYVELSNRVVELEV